MPQTPYRPIKTVIITDETTVALLATLTTAFAVYSAEAILLADELHPEAAVIRLEREITQAPDTATRQALQDQMARFAGVGAKAAQAGAKRSVTALYPAVTAASTALLNQTVVVANGFLTQALADEGALFALYGFQPFPTPISIGAKAVIAELNSLLDGLQYAQQQERFGVIPGTECNPLIEWFKA